MFVFTIFPDFKRVDVSLSCTFGQPTEAKSVSNWHPDLTAFHLHMSEQTSAGQKKKGLNSEHFFL